MSEKMLESVIFGLKQTIAEKDKEIEQLKSENTELYKEHTLVIAGSIKQANELKAEIERLTEERDKAKQDNTSLLYNISRVEKENAELQKQVEELKAENESYGKTINEASETIRKKNDRIFELQNAVWDLQDDFDNLLEEGKRQAVKDTAKEILQKIMNIIKKSNGFLAEEVIRIIAGQKGVEVD